MDRNITVGAFRGLLLPEGTLRLQMRTEGGSALRPDVSYRGDFELSGGRVKATLLRDALTLDVLLAESAREAREELRIDVGNPVNPRIYRTVFVSDDGREDWAIVIPTPPECWDADAEMARKTVDVNPDQLKVLGDLNLIVSGIGKRMWRMAQASLTFSAHIGFSGRASALLDEYKPGWKETELFTNPEDALAGFRRELGL